VVGDARRSAEGAEVDHRTGLGDEKGVLRRRPGAAAVPRHLSAPVDGEGLTLVAPERAEIEARACRQEIGVEVAEPGVATAGDFAVVVDVVRRGVHTGERLQVDDPQRLFPQERPGAALGVAARADDLTSAVHGLPLAHRTTQCAEVPDGDGDYRRPSSRLAHNPASTAVSDVGPSNRRTRMAARPARSTATRCRIEIWPSAGLYRSRSWAPPASPAEPSRMAGPARALKSSTHAWRTSIASFCGACPVIPRAFPSYGARSHHPARARAGDTAAGRLDRASRAARSTRAARRRSGPAGPSRSYRTRC